MALSAQLKASIVEHSEWTTELYKHFHRHPELSGEEENTASRIEQELVGLGLETQRIGGTGVVAVIENGPGRTLLARADIDGLPVTEIEKVDYRSETPGVMHACGHDSHMSVLLAAVRVLVENRDQWSGTYIAVFQPAEETASGAKAMVEDGLVDKVPTPDLAVAQHIGPYPAGTVSVAAGPIYSQGDSVRVTIHGRGGHGSMPQASVDPVVLASTIVVRLQTVVSRMVTPGTFSVVTVGAINAGTKSNIIPETGELLLNLRHYDPAVRETVIAAIERIITKECEAAGTPKPPTFEYYDQFPLMANDADATAQVRTMLQDDLGEENVLHLERVAASEDFANIPNAFGTPYVFWIAGGTDPALAHEALQTGDFSKLPTNHSPAYIPQIEPTLSVMTTAMVSVAAQFLSR